MNTSPPVVNNLIWILGFYVFWVVSFAAAWKISERRVYSFQHKFSPAERADWCSRVNSTIHALGSAIGIFIVLGTTEWNDFIPQSSLAGERIVFAFSASYFLFDLLVVYAWKVQLWQLFVVHHSVAVIPYVFDLFVYEAPGVQYLLLLFMLVEIATLPLNARGFHESLGGAGDDYHRKTIYATYITWAVVRFALPIYLIYTMWAVAYGSVDMSPVMLWVGLICGHIIAFFCIGVFLFVLTPEVLNVYRHVHTGECRSLDGSDQYICDYSSEKLREQRDTATTDASIIDNAIRLSRHSSREIMR